MTILALLSGYKTYIAAAGLLGLSLYQLSQGDGSQSFATFLQALTAAGLRSAIASIQAPAAK